VSIATITPTVVNKPQPASATKNNAIVILPPDIKNSPHSAAAMVPAVGAVTAAIGVFITRVRKGESGLKAIYRGF
jgi:hypothetical protein